ncbi:MAG: NAD-dependent epimerase/dehydratase family protein [Terriglobia bacterium]
MKAFVVGATGALGRETVAELLARGHQVVALARTAAVESAFAQWGIPAVHGDIFDTAVLERGARDADAVFHLATRIPRKPIPRRRDFAETNRIRTEGTRRLAVAAKRVSAKALLFQSIAFIYGDHRGAEVTERTLPYDHPLIAAVLDGELTTLHSGLRGVVLRGGQFFQRGSYHTDWMAAALRKRRLPLIGRGDAYVNPVHPRDLARAFVLAAEKETARGIYHVAAQPVEARVLYTEWAHRLGAPPPRHLPYWLARLLLGELAKLARFRYRVSSEKIRRELGFQFRFPTYEEILDDLIAA